MKITLFKLFNKLYATHFDLYDLFYRIYKYLTDGSKIRLLRQLVIPGMITIDVGANIGFYTQLLAQLVGPSGRVYAFEPDAQNFSHLRQVARLYRQVVPMRSAVGDITGKLKLFVSPDLNVDHQSFDTGEQRRVQSVRCVRLDDYLSTDIKADVIKMDIQGFEYQALEGMTKLIRRSPRLILLSEFWPYGLTKAGHSPTDYLRKLKQLGLTVRFLDRSEVWKTKVGDQNYYCDLLATKGYQTLNFR